MEKRDTDSDTGFDLDSRFLRSNLYSQISVSLRVLREADHLPPRLVEYAYNVLKGIVYGSEMSLLQIGSQTDAQDIPTQGE